VTTLFLTSFQKLVTTKNDKMITSNLTNTTIKLEQKKDLKNAPKKEKTHLNPTITFIQLH
jgi:hypothetical protein